jgi:hypothetical protein
MAARARLWRRAVGTVSVHAPVAPVEQDWSRQPVADSLVEGATDSWRQGYQSLLAAFAVDKQDAVTMFLAEILDIGAAGFGDAESEQAEHRDQGEVEPVGRLPGRGQDRFELQMGSPSTGDSFGTRGRRTYSAGECSRTTSMTQVR